MRKIAIIILSAVFLQSCNLFDFDNNNDEPRIKSEFICLIDGVKFEPGPNIFIQEYGIRWGTDSTFVFFASNRGRNQYINFFANDFEGVGEYRLNNDEGKVYSTYLVDRCHYDRSEDTYRDGYFIVDEFAYDEVLELQYMSGTFEFELAIPGCDTVRITNGRYTVLWE
jgi:hypothetical protein